MPKIERHINHTMSLDTAKNTVNDIIEKVKSAHGSMISSFEWNEDKTAANVKGSAFAGSFKVSETTIDIEIDVKLPGFIAKPIMPKIEAEIDENLKDIK